MKAFKMAGDNLQPNQRFGLLCLVQKTQWSFVQDKHACLVQNHTILLAMRTPYYLTLYSNQTIKSHSKTEL